MTYTVTYSVWNPTTQALAQESQTNTVTGTVNGSANVVVTVVELVESDWPADNIIIGQNEVFQCDSLPAGATVANIHWTYSPADVYQYSASVNSSPEPIAVRPDDLSVSISFVPPGPQTVSCSADINGVPCTVSTTYNILQPSITSLTPQNGSSGVDSQYAAWAYNHGFPVDPNSTWLHYGVPVMLNGTDLAGVSTTITYEILGAAPNGDLEIYQVMQDYPSFVSTSGGLNYTTAWTEVPGCDGACPYGWDQGTPTEYYPGSYEAIFNDAPGIAVDPCRGFGTTLVTASVNNAQWQDWLMYNPEVGNSIYVPLEFTQWSWSASAATGDDGVWSLTGSAGAGPSWSDTTTFPLWNAAAVPPSAWTQQ